MVLKFGGWQPGIKIIGVLGCRKWKCSRDFRIAIPKDSHLCYSTPRHFAVTSRISCWLVTSPTWMVNSLTVKSYRGQWRSSGRTNQTQFHSRSHSRFAHFLDIALTKSPTWQTNTVKNFIWQFHFVVSRSHRARRNVARPLSGPCRPWLSLAIPFLSPVKHNMVLYNCSLT